MYVVGTAGHVDHGKSTLIKALTGIDPDRLREEKERGMTIDLGFAWLSLPSGREVSIVDVPGHERFIKNMLAGVGGIDVALLVVAADEGVMPQTREHLAILDLLRIERGVVALTKADLVDAEWLELVEADVADTLQGTALADAAVIPVSGVTGVGLPELLAALDEQLAHTPPKRDIGRPRLPVDRVFSIAGFGTIVTGTLVDGRFQVGQEIEILPRGTKTRIRTLQTHKHKVDSAVPGSRVAMNLAGVAVEELARGDVVTTPRWLVPTRAVDVQLRVLASAPKALAHGATVGFHTGSAEIQARVSLLDREEVTPGETGWAQLRLDAPAAVVKGDLFIVRSPNTTLGGGEIVDAHPRRHRRFQSAVTRVLETMQAGSPEELVLQALEGPVPLGLQPVARQAGLTEEAARAVLAELARSAAVVTLNGLYTSPASWQRLSEQVTEALGAYHRQFPLRRGMPKEELKSRLNLSPRLFTLVLERLQQEGAVADDGVFARLPEHSIVLTPEQSAGAKKLLTLLRANPYSPPSRGDLERETGLEPEVVNALAELGEVRRVSDSIIFPTEIYDEMVGVIVARIRESGKIAVGEVRDQFQTSRKYALAILEHLDEERITRRVGDERVLR